MQINSQRHEKMINLMNYWGDANWNHNEMPLIKTTVIKSQTLTSLDKYIIKLELSYALLGM
jgi:hypothetical protein